jgi:hypothetical protein
MKYVFPLYMDEPDGPPSDNEMKRWMDFQEDAAKVAAHVAGEALQPVATATTISMRAGEIITTDGPYADTKEHLGGFYIYDCKDLDVALEIAAKMPMVVEGRLDVRELRVFQAGN